MKNNLDELLSTLESIREAKYPNIDSQILKELVQIQAAYQDDPAKRETETYKALAKYIASTKGV